MLANDLESIISVEKAQRDERWEELFLNHLCQAKVYLQSEEIYTAADGFPYLFIQTMNNSSGLVENFQKLVQWCGKEGIGIVVNPDSETGIDYLFSYGMLWYFGQTGRFFQRGLLETSDVNIQPSMKYQNFDISLQLIPSQVRAYIVDFFSQQGVVDLRLAALQFEGDEGITFAVSLESLGTPPESEFEGILMALGWFLPPHYNLMVLSEDSIEGFSSISTQ